jgi:hypothetical protein
MATNRPRIRNRPTTEEEPPPRTRGRKEPPKREFDIQAALKIDENELDEEMLRQPFLFHELARSHVMAISRRDAAKEELATVDAQLAKEFRDKAARADEKMTEAKLTDMVLLDPRHKEAFEHFSELKLEADRLWADREAFEQRGKMLRELGGLFVAGYFDRVSVKKGKQDVRNANSELARQLWKEGNKRTRQDD